jgi:hypothetical protein
MYAFDSDPIYLYRSGYMYGPVAINAKVAEKAVSDSIFDQRCKLTAISSWCPKIHCWRMWEYCFGIVKQPPNVRVNQSEFW